MVAFIFLISPSLKKKKKKKSLKQKSGIYLWVNEKHDHAEE